MFKKKKRPGRESIYFRDIFSRWKKLKINGAACRQKSTGKQIAEFITNGTRLSERNGPVRKDRRRADVADRGKCDEMMMLLDGAIFQSSCEMIEQHSVKGRRPVHQLVDQNVGVGGMEGGVD